MQALRNKDNAVVNRAAVGLGSMKDTTAIAPLIDSLITTHTFTIQKGDPGQMSAAFGRGPGGNSFGGMSVGGSNVEVIKQNIQNRAVLQALTDLTGGVSFGFDMAAWKNWYAGQKKPQSLDAHRDDPAP